MGYQVLHLLERPRMDPAAVASMETSISQSKKKKNRRTPMVIASDMLATKDGVLSPALTEVATDEPCRNGIYKTSISQSKKKKKVNAPQGSLPPTCLQPGVGYQVPHLLKRPQMNPAMMASTKTSISQSKKKKNSTHPNGHRLRHVGDQGWGAESCTR